MVSVYQRCLANYQSRQWDAGAYVLFNTSLTSTLFQIPIPTPSCTMLSTGQCLGDCLLASSVGACLDAWLQTTNVASLDHFMYGNGTSGGTADACQVRGTSRPRGRAWG